MVEVETDSYKHNQSYFVVYQDEHEHSELNQRQRQWLLKSSLASLMGMNSFNISLR